MFALSNGACDGERGIVPFTDRSEQGFQPGGADPGFQFVLSQAESASAKVAEIIATFIFGQGGLAVGFHGVPLGLGGGEFDKHQQTATHCNPKIR
jgi:hypothetical protein